MHVYALYLDQGHGGGSHIRSVVISLAMAKDAAEVEDPNAAEHLWREDVSVWRSSRPNGWEWKIVRLYVQTDVHAAFLSPETQQDVDAQIRSVDQMVHDELRGRCRALISDKAVLQASVESQRAEIVRLHGENAAITNTVDAQLAQVLNDLERERDRAAALTQRANVAVGNTLRVSAERDRYMVEAGNQAILLQEAHMRLDQASVRNEQLEAEVADQRDRVTGYQHAVHTAEAASIAVHDVCKALINGMVRTLIESTQERS